jgi:hypothetical protein
MSQQRGRKTAAGGRTGRLPSRAAAVIIVAGVLVGWLGWKAYLNFRDGYGTAREVLELERDVQQAQAEHARLQSYRDDIRTPAGKQLEARRQFLRVNPGERLLVPGEGEDLDAPARAAEGDDGGPPGSGEVLKRWTSSPQPERTPPADE